jgi:hypothetical protein
MTTHALCQTCEATIEAAQRSIVEGASVDLAGLDTEVERICASLILLPSEERAAAAHALQQLSVALDRLAATVKEQKAGLRDSDERATPGQAAQAYGQTRHETG